MCLVETVFRPFLMGSPTLVPPGRTSDHGYFSSYTFTYTLERYGVLSWETVTFVLPPKIFVTKSLLWQFIFVDGKHISSLSFIFGYVHRRIEMIFFLYVSFYSVGFTLTNEPFPLRPHPSTLYSLSLCQNMKELI